MGKRLDNARSFIRGIKQTDDPAPIYFVYGEEPYMLDQAVEAIIETAAPEGTNDFNFDKFRGSDATAEDIRESAEMLPMMVDRRIVLVRDLQEMAVSEIDQLEDYFEAPSEKTCLILHAHRDKPGDLDLRRGVFKTLKSNAETCEFESLYDSDAESVVRKHAKQRGLKFDSEARAYIVDAVGTDIASLTEALDKVDLYIGESDQEGPRDVDVDILQEVIAETRVRSIFDLTDALGACKYEEAVSILDKMLLAGEPPLRILHMIARHFRLVAKLHDPNVRQMDKYDQASELQVPHFFVDDYRSDARTFTADELAEIRSRILEVDKQLKSAGLSDRTDLEDLLYAICYRDGEGAAAHTKKARG